MLYGYTDNLMMQRPAQINGSASHAAVDAGKYTTRKNILQSVSVYSEKYNLIGKIDIFDLSKGELIERKRKITTIYDGYVFQLYAQYFALTEMGYQVKKLFFYSMTDNKKYEVLKPESNPEMLEKFEETISNMTKFEIDNFIQTNPKKCRNCIYEPACDRGKL